MRAIVASACLALLASCAPGGNPAAVSGRGPVGAVGAARDETARTVVELFVKACVRSLGHRDQAEAVVLETDARAERLPAQELARLQQGRPGGVGWWVAMPPLQAPLLVEFDQHNLCSVRAVDANGAAIQDGVRGMLDAFAKCCQMSYQTVEERDMAWQAEPVRFMHYRLRLPSTRVTQITVMTTMRPVSPRFSIMTAWMQGHEL